MAELDLTKAIESGSAVSSVKWEMDEGGRKLRPYPYAKVAEETKRILEIALPDILDALAERAEADKTAAAERFRTAPTATERVDASQWGDVCELAAVWLRARAEEARRG